MQREKFLDIKLNKAYDVVNFTVDKDIKALTIKWSNNKQFFSAYIFAPDKKLYAQIIAAKENGERRIAIIQSSCSPCCQSFKPNIAKGVWSLEYGVLNKCDADDISLEIYEGDLDSEENSFNEVNLFDSIKMMDDGPKKTSYAADFHTHTIYSDGKMSREANNDVAIKQGLDFFVPTDHNVYHYTWPNHEGLKVYPGIEITSSLGHINLLFAEKTPFAEHAIYEIEDEEGLVKIIKEAKDYSLISVNHPCMPPWDFHAKSFPLDLITFMEVINDPTYMTSKKAIKDAIKAWNYLLNDGYRVISIGGSDSHLLPEEKYEGSAHPSLLGDPKTIVYAKENTAEALKDAMLAGEVSVTRSKEIKLSANGLARENENFTGRASLRAELLENNFQSSALHISWLIDGECVKDEKAKESMFSIEIDSAYHWIRVDVWDEDGNLYGYNNPIFFNRKTKEHEMKVWGDLMEKMSNEK